MNISSPYVIGALPPSAAVDFHIDSYLVHVHQQECLHCHRTVRWSQTFEVLVNDRLTGRTAAHQLRPAARLQGGFPIGVSMLRPETVPCCHECFASFAGDELPIPDTRAPISRDEWAQTLKRKYATPEAAPAAARPKHIPTLDDL